MGLTDQANVFFPEFVNRKKVHKLRYRVNKDLGETDLQKLSHFFLKSGFEIAMYKREEETKYRIAREARIRKALGDHGWTD